MGFPRPLFLCTSERGGYAGRFLVSVILRLRDFERVGGNRGVEVVKRARRVVALFVASQFLWAALMFPRTAFAGLPALALVEPALSFVSGIVVRNVAKEAVVTVGVAANDASWVVANTSLLARTAVFLGLGGLVADTGSEKYQVPLVEAQNSKLPKAVPQSGVGTWDAPLPYTHPALRFTAQPSFCPVLGWGSTDGQDHRVPQIAYASLQALLDACKQNLTYSKFPGPAPFIQQRLRPGADWQYAPKPVAFGGKTYYAHDYEICLDGLEEGSTEGYCTNPMFANEQFWISMVEAVDGVFRFHKGPLGWIADPTDPDWDTVPAKKAALAAQSSLSFTGPNLAGQATQLDLQVNAASQVQMQARTQIDAANVKSRELVLSPAMEPVSFTESVYPATSTAPGTAPGTSPGTETPKITFPDDYAREATTQAIRTSAQTIAEGFKPADALADPTMPTSSDLADIHFKDAFSSLLAWRLPAHSSVCPVATFDLFGRRLVMDSQCQLARDHMAGVADAMAVVFVIGALFIVLRA